MRTTYIVTTLILVSASVYGDEPLIVAHRGASRDAPENTIEAFNLAWEQGADAIEGDFHLTRDGHIVCLHNSTTEHVANANLVIRESTLAQLRELDVGAYRGEAFKSSVIPTLAEVFSTIPDGRKIYVEVKCGTEIIPALIEEIGKSGLKREQVVVISFSETVIEEFKSQAPAYKAYWLCNFKKEDSGEITPALEIVLETLALAKADGLSSNINIPAPVLKSITECGYEWHVWTINDLATAKRFKQWGAQSITTDVPGFLKRNLAEQAAEPDESTAARCIRKSGQPDKFVEVRYVDDTLAYAPTQEETRHGYVTFSCYGMDLVFPNSIPMAKQTRDSLTAFTWGENYEPITF